MVTGRAGSAIATELGTMRVTEQIDAMESMAVSPIQYLVVPRVIASLLMFPVLTMLFDALGYGGAYLMGVYVAGIPVGPFIEHTRQFLGIDDVLHGLWKAVVFGADRIDHHHLARLLRQRRRARRRGGDHPGGGGELHRHPPRRLRGDGHLRGGLRRDRGRRSLEVLRRQRTC